MSVFHPQLFGDLLHTHRRAAGLTQEQLAALSGLSARAVGDLERGAKIQYTWMSPFTRGLESIVTVELQKKGDDTLLQLRHANLPDDDLGHQHDGGWNQLVGVLSERFQARKNR